MAIDANSPLLYLGLGLVGCVIMLPIIILVLLIGQKPRSKQIINIKQWIHNHPYKSVLSIFPMAFVWSALYALIFLLGLVFSFDQRPPLYREIIAGGILAFAPWLFYNIAVCPITGLGIFGYKLKSRAAFWSLLIFILWGATLGLVFYYIFLYLIY